MTLNEEIPHPVLRAFREEEDVEKEELLLLISISTIVVFSGAGVTGVFAYKSALAGSNSIMHIFNAKCIEPNNLAFFNGKKIYTT